MARSAVDVRKWRRSKHRRNFRLCRLRPEVARGNLLRELVRMNDASDTPSSATQRDGFRDPVCGMMVDPGHAAGSLVHERRSFYFCSAHCLAAFQADPVRFLNQSAGDSRPGTEHTHAAKPPAAGAYFCPMHPEVSATRAGSCPQCGMALERAATPQPAVEYTCPMHPEIVRDRPGACPKCGMALEAR